MPKGVDHSSTGQSSLDCPRVQKSLMPKGVDHLTGIHSGSTRLSAKIFDAERR